MRGQLTETNGKEADSTDDRTDDDYNNMDGPPHGGRTTMRRDERGETTTDEDNDKGRETKDYETTTTHMRSVSAQAHNLLIIGGRRQKITTVCMKKV